jgi:hypothetical protein
MSGRASGPEVSNPAAVARAGIKTTSTVHSPKTALAFILDEPPDVSWF